MSEIETRHYLANGQKTTPAAKEAIAWAGQTQAQMVDLKFCDLLGTWQHMTLPISAFDESSFDEGLGFDGSSIRGWQGISESDMLLMPDAASAILDPFTEAPTLSILCEIADPVTRQPYGRDPRGVARRAEAYLESSGIADTAYFGPECEFFVLDEVSYDLGPNHSHYAVDSAEGHWNSGKPGLGYTVREKEGYFPPAPHDTLHDLRTRMVLTLERLGIPCEFHHHEVASGGQCEIDLRYGPLTRMADQVMTYKYVVKNVARAAGKTVTFMPKPLFGDNGSGMHSHQSLWKDGETLMADADGYAGLSATARSYIGGLLAHAPALLAFCAPTTNSYRRLVPGYEAPVNLVYSQRNRSACIRIPMYSESPKAKRIEFRCPDAAANPYLAFSAMLMAGIDGIERGLDPGAPADYDLFEEIARRGAAGAVVARRGARRARGGPRVPHEGRRLQRGADPDLDRLQARERGRRRPAPAAPGRVRPLLRLLGACWLRELQRRRLAGGAGDLRAGDRRRAGDVRDRGSGLGRHWDQRAPGAAIASSPQDGEVVGWAALSPCPSAASTRASPRTASTSPHAAQGRGVGRALLEELVRRAEPTASGRSRQGSSRRTRHRSGSTSAAASASSACASGSASTTASGGTSSSWNGDRRRVS